MHNLHGALISFTFRDIQPVALYSLLNKCEAVLSEKFMKSIILSAILSLALATGAFATTQDFSGTGIDGQPCSIKINRDGKKIHSIELEGATETFELLSENGDDYGPTTEIDENGATKMLELLQANNQMFSYMTISKMLFRKGEVIHFNTNDVPQTNENSNSNWFNMIFAMDLHYDKEGNIKEVKAKSKMKTILVFTLASRLFTCR